jgi:hypothetical protein
MILTAVEAKSAVHVRTWVALNDLFRSLLHQLMTAQVRVRDLNLVKLGVETGEPSASCDRPRRATDIGRHPRRV